MKTARSRNGYRTILILLVALGGAAHAQYVESGVRIFRPKQAAKADLLATCAPRGTVVITDGADTYKQTAEAAKKEDADTVHITREIYLHPGLSLGFSKPEESERYLDLYQCANQPPKTDLKPGKTAGSKLLRVAVLNFGHGSQESKFQWLSENLRDSIESAIASRFNMTQLNKSQAARIMGRTKGIPGPREIAKLKKQCDLVISGEYSYNAKTQKISINVQVNHAGTGEVIGNSSVLSDTDDRVYSAADLASTEVNKLLLQFMKTQEQ